MDKYDEAIAALRAAPDFRRAVYRAWLDPSGTAAGCLFVAAAPDPRMGLGYGCLSQVKHKFLPGFTDELTAAIKADPRIPKLPADITPESLDVFAEWQRRLDKEFNRK